MDRIIREIKPQSAELGKYAEEWRDHGSRPPEHLIIEPSVGEESVWNYPRPPLVQEVETEVLVYLREVKILEAKWAMRICETASPPTYYFKPSDFNISFSKNPYHSFCEWKGEATYFDIELEGKKWERVFWCYETPPSEYEWVKDLISFYPGKFETFLFNERVEPQPGEFYAGWVTKRIKGPFKGGPGTQSW